MDRGILGGTMGGGEGNHYPHSLKGNGGGGLGLRITYFIQLRTAISAACLYYRAYLSLARSKDVANAYNFSFS